MFFLSFILILLFTSFVWGEGENITPEKIINKQIQELPISEIEGIINNFSNEIEDYIPKINIREYIMDIIRGNNKVRVTMIVEGFGKILFKEVLANWKLLVEIIVLSAICAVLKNLHSAFQDDAVGHMSYNVCYLVIISITIKSFIIAINIGRETIDLMVSFMQALMPVLLTMLVAVGGITTSAFFSPVILGAVAFTGTLIKNIIMPLILFSAVLAIVNNLSSKIQIGKMSGLIKQAAGLMLGFILTVFVGVISIQGVTAATIDGVTIRTTKFAVDKFVPIVGSFLSDAIDTVVGCSLLVKNAIGSMGLIFILLLCMVPMIKILALIIIYKLSAALIEPISDDGLVDCLNSMGNSLVFLFAAVVSVAIMFFITIGVIVATGNITTMMR